MQIPWLLRICFSLFSCAAVATLLRGKDTSPGNHKLSNEQCQCSQQQNLAHNFFEHEEQVQERLVPNKEHERDIQVFKNAVLQVSSVFINGEYQATPNWGCGGNGDSKTPPGYPDFATCKEVDTAVALGQGNTRMYWHLSTEVMSRLAMVAEQHPESLSGNTVFTFVPPSKQVKQQASDWAALMGFNISADSFQQGCFKAKKVIYPPSNGCCDVRPQTVQSMRRLLHRTMCRREKHCQEKPKHGGTLNAVLIKRCKAGKRVALNSDDLERALRKQGWNLTVHSDVEMSSIREQCKLFNRADMVIGPHGAGFANLLCAPSWAEVIEIGTTAPFGQKATVNLAAGLNLSYNVVTTDSPYRLPQDGCGTIDVEQATKVAAQVKKKLQGNKAVKDI